VLSAHLQSLTPLSNSSFQSHVWGAQMLYRHNWSAAQSSSLQQPSLGMHLFAQDLNSSAHTHWPFVHFWFVLQVMPVHRSWAMGVGVVLAVVVSSCTGTVCNSPSVQPARTKRMPSSTRMPKNQPDVFSPTPIAKTSRYINFAVVTLAFRSFINNHSAFAFKDTSVTACVCQNH